jgi:hypothetical protein
MYDPLGVLRLIADAYPRIPELTPDQLAWLTAYLRTLPPVATSRPPVIGTSSAHAARLLPAAIPDPAATERLRRLHLEQVLLTNERRLAALQPPQSNPVAQTAATKRRTRNPPRDRGLEAQCVGVYMEGMHAGTPYSVAEIARRVGCHPSTASRAIKPYEELRDGQSQPGPRGKRRGR